MKKIFQKPSLTICDLSDVDIITESAQRGSDFAPDDEEPAPARSRTIWDYPVWLLLPLLMLPLFSSCESDSLTEEEIPNSSPDNVLVETRVLAYPEEKDPYSSDNSTRAEFAEEKSGFRDVLWQDKDEVSVIYNLNEDKFNQNFVLTNGAGTKIGTFTGKTHSASNTLQLTALSPFQEQVNYLSNNSICNVVLPTLQVATSGSFDRHAGLQISSVQNVGQNPEEDKVIEMDFKHLCSFVEVCPPFDCASIIVSTRSPKEYLAGKLYTTDYFVDLSTEGNKSELVNKVTLKGEIKANQTYYIAVIPGTLQNGIRITCVSQDGRMYTRQTKSSVTLERRKYHSFSAFLTKNPNEANLDGVDLGTGDGVLWASCNVGATAPEEFGDKFEYGETLPLYSYDVKNLFYKSDVEDVENYKGWIADAATANVGSAWRMPNTEELNHLLNKCTWEFVADYNNTGVSGWKVEGNNNQIFLPTPNNTARYWTKASEEVEKAPCLRLTTTKHEASSAFCYISYYIRPVRTSN